MLQLTESGKKRGFGGTEVSEKSVSFTSSHPSLSPAAASVVQWAGVVLAGRDVTPVAELVVTFVVTHPVRWGDVLERPRGRPSHWRLALRVTPSLLM